MRALLPEILEALPWPEGYVLTRLYWEGASLREVAGELGLHHPERVKHVMRRAFRRIRELVEE